MQATDVRPLRLEGRVSVGADTAFGGEKLIRLGRFAIVPTSRILLCEGRLVQIGARAFDVLLTLLRAHGRIVEKSEIVKNVWPSTVVDDCNIRFQVNALRKILGPDGDKIKTIPGRGYLLVDRDVECELVRPILGDLTIAAPVKMPNWLRIGLDKEAGPAKGSQYVAIIDDDITVLEALSGLIRSVGICVGTFLSTKAFLDSDQSAPPSCIILDAWMPTQDGLDFQSELIDAGVRVPIIFISGHADVAMSVRAIKAGALDFLTKPVRHEDLLSAIRLAMITENEELPSA